MLMHSVLTTGTFYHMVCSRHVTVSNFYIVIIAEDFVIMNQYCITTEIKYTAKNRLLKKTSILCPPNKFH